MTPLNAVQPLPAGSVPVPWPLPPRRNAGRRSAAARRASRIEREQRRVHAEWQASGKRERVRQMGERLIATVERLRSVEAGVILAEGGILAELVRGGRFESLGFVRQSDFAREALKLHPRTLRRRVALHRVLEAVPELAEPFLEGRTGVSQVLALRDVVTPQNLKIWVNVAERLSVRELQSLVRRVKERQEGGETASGADAEAGAADPDDALEEPPRHRISFLSPQSAAFAIEHGLETAKRVLGHEAPRDECLEAVLSEAESTLALPPVADTEPGRNDLARFVFAHSTSDEETTLLLEGMR
jgi:hypothetical protein